ncbi:MAG TPA: uracil phosphoribosyltransferase [Clostridiales bacterium]|nr:uracil phosphoribosyltransferase [Clostridiales bacterium]
MQKFENVRVFDHPLIAHKIALLRDEKTNTKHFRELVEEITALMAYEALKDVPTKKVTVKTPLESCTQNVVEDDSVVIVPILRAGLGMVNGVHTLFPTAKVGHIGIYRDEKSLLPQEYYCKLPDHIEDKICIVLDPMLATGGSAKATIDILKKKYGCKKIKLMSIIAAPEGLEAVATAHKDVKIFVSAVDRQLNEKGYILPGLGDAGDRLFGTK